jgi:hypothetical protein
MRDFSDKIDEFGFYHALFPNADEENVKKGTSIDIQYRGSLRSSKL